MSFFQDFSNTPPGPQREQLVYEALVRQGKPKDLYPVTVPGPNGSKITYYIMKDFFHVDADPSDPTSHTIWTPMTGTTLQKLAAPNVFNMKLPTVKIADQVWDIAQKSQSSVTVHPLSGTGYQGKDRFYSGNDVVAGRIGATDAALAFSKKIEEARKNNPNVQAGPFDIGSGGKWIVMPASSGGRDTLGLHGIRQPQGTIQGGYGTIHPNYEDQVEYGTLARLIDNKVDVELSNGTKDTLTIDEFITKYPQLTSAIFQEGQDLRGGQLAKYDLGRDKAQLASLDKSLGVGGGSAGGTPSNQSGDKTLDWLNQMSQSLTASITDRLIKKYGGTIEMMSNIGKDPAIKDISASSIPGHPPDGFMPLPAGEKSGDIGSAARQILEHSSLGDQVPFKIDDQLYIGRSEPHYHPGPSADERAKLSEAELKAKYPATPWGWHRGVTVFKAKEGTTAPQQTSTPSDVEETSPGNNSKARMSVLQRIDDFLSEMKGGL